MHWQFTPYGFPMLASAVISILLAMAAWRRRPASGALPFCLLMLAMAEWSLAYVRELASFTLFWALFWNNVAWLGAIAAPTLWLVFALRYTGRGRWLARQNLAFLLVEPLFMLLLIWTNGFHGPFEHVIRLDTVGPFSALIVTHGMWYWVNIAYSYLLLLLGAFVVCSFILASARSAHLYCLQGACLFVAVVAPWVGNVVTLSGLSPFAHLDLTPFAFIISCLAFAAGLFFFGLLEIVPIAREVVIESMRDAAIVLDTQDRVVDLNPAARSLVNCSSARSVGRPFAEVFSTWPELVECCDDPVVRDKEVIRGEGEMLRSFGLHISPLYRRNGRLSITGRLIVLYDITESIQAQRALKESEERFRNIFAEAPVGMAVVDREDQMLQVNRAFCEMVDYQERELIGRSLTSITHPDDVEKDKLLASQALRGEISSYKVEKRYLRKNHETLWADLTATMLRDQDGQAIYGLMMFENAIERKRAKLLEEERRFVAYELHDGLAQVVASAHQHLQAFASHYHPRSPQARQELDQALKLAQHSVREARRLIAGLRPTILEDFGLATALRLQVDAHRNDGWTVIYDESLQSERLPPTIETTLFGVAQEALTNVQKHAHTTQVRLVLERRESNVHLEVQDWGCGFELCALPHQCNPGEHMGIRGMQERMELVGGHLLISSQPGVGTRVVAEASALIGDERSRGYEQ